MYGGGLGLHGAGLYGGGLGLYGGGLGGLGYGGGLGFGGLGGGLGYGGGLIGGKTKICIEILNKLIIMID